MINLKNKLLSFNFKNYCRNNVLFLTFVISSVINGLLIRILTVGNYLDVRPIIADAGVVILIGAFGYLISPKRRFIYYLVWGSLYSIICLINSMYYTNYLSFSSISLIATSFLIVDVGDAVTQNVMEIKDFCYLWEILIIVLVHIKLCRNNYYVGFGKSKGNFKSTILIGLFILILFALTLSPSDISRITKQWNREYVVMRYGIYTYQFSDLFASLTPTINSMFGYDKNAKMFRDYYLDNSYSGTSNEYSNIFEGKNVLVIHAESIQNFVLNTSINGVDLAPNLKKLAGEGLYFSNFYAEESVGTSSDSEFSFSTSLLPATSGTVAINYFDRDYPTIQKLFKDRGYYVFSMHGNNCSFWNRNLLHQSFGYDKFYCHTNDYDIDETIGLGLSDKSFFRQSVNYIKDISRNHKNWYGTMIMLTNHTPFSYIGEHSDLDVSYKYEVVNPDTKEVVTKKNNYLEGTVLGNYFKSVHYADEAIGELVKSLDKQGLLDNTVLIIYGDHDAKIKKNEYEYYYNYDYKTDSVFDKNDPNFHEVTDYEYEINRKVPFIIWSKNNNLSKEFTGVGGMIDAMPTIGNLFGINNTYALGHDLTSVSDNVVVFPDGNWITDKMYYNSQKEEALLINSKIPISVDYIENYNKIAEERISISNSIIVYDLIRRTNEQAELIKKGG